MVIGYDDNGSRKTKKKKTWHRFFALFPSAHTTTHKTLYSDNSVDLLLGSVSSKHKVLPSHNSGDRLESSLPETMWKFWNHILNLTKAL